MKVVLATARSPWPARRGDQLRALQFLAALEPEHEVTVLAPEGPEAPQGPVRIRRYRSGATERAVALLTAWVRRRPIQSGLFASRQLRALWREEVLRSDLAITQLARLAPQLLPRAKPEALVVDLIDSLSLNFRRRAAVDRAWRRPLLLAEAGRLASAEAEVVRRSRISFVVCERDRTAMLEHSVRGQLPTDGSLEVLPLALAAPGPTCRAESDSRQLVFTGNLGYFVNSDAVLWFAREVWPQLHARQGDVRWTIAGDRPPEAVRRLDRLPGVSVVASPHDLGDVLRSARVAIAPMRCGSGVPVKVLEAWACGTPVVASAWAGAGTEGVEGEDFLVAESPSDWVTSVLRLWNSEEERASLRDAGSRRLRAVHSPDVIATRLRERLAEVWPHSFR